MGSLIHKLNYLAETKVKIRQALQRVGSKVTEQDTFRSYADYISKIDTSPAGAVSELHVNGRSAEGIGGGIDSKTVIREAVPGNGSISVTWTPLAVATKYRVFTYLNNEYTRIADTTSTNYTITGLTNGITYGVYVISYVNDRWVGSGAENIVYATPSENLRSFSYLDFDNDENKNEEKAKKSEENSKELEETNKIEYQKEE